jgi:hypothetical protein
MECLRERGSANRNLTRRRGVAETAGNRLRNVPENVTSPPMVKRRVLAAGHGVEQALQGS